jgi:hypothetical protein
VPVVAAKGKGFVVFRILVRLVLIASSLAILFIPTLAQGISITEAARMLPDRVGDLRAQGPADEADLELSGRPEDFQILSRARRLYVSSGGETFKVTLIKTRTDSAAFSLLTHFAPNLPTSPIKSGEVGTASVSRPGGVFFFKGPAAVEVSASNGSSNNDALLLEAARPFADGLDAGEGGVPVLALHLPEWEKVRGQVDYALGLPVLKNLVGDEPVMDAVSFEGGAEAVTARYGDSRLVIIEFTTPQYATDNDARIQQRIAELRAAGQRAPSAYRRVGNYSVFVFGASDEQAAAGLVGQVQYEKDVRWLGRNPHEAAMREKFLTTTMGGVVVTTLKATGVAILICLGVGGLFGGVVFMMRRARTTAAQVYTDAGGMLRLNIEDVNARTDPARLLDGGAKK